MRPTGSNTPHPVKHKCLAVVAPSSYPRLSTRQRRRSFAVLWRWLLCLLPLCLIAADVPRLDPLLQRVDLAPAEATQISLIVHGAPGTTVTAVLVDCACLSVITPLPTSITADRAVTLRFRASGVRPGIEEIRVVTSAGTLRAQLQIVGPGSGDGLSALRAMLAHAQEQRLAVWGIVHDLRGQIRNCGCSKGSLGGIGHLAALPAQARAIAPTVSTRWILTGDSDGQRVGVGAALVERGWRIGDPAVTVSAEPLSLLATLGIAVVIPTVPIAVNHRRLLRPVLTGGLVVELLLVDDSLTIREHRVLPVDATLADDAAMISRFPDTLTKIIDATAHLSASCMACHATAHAIWSASRHAQALEHLPVADRTDACITCHTTPIREKAIAGGVSCLSCHTGADAHAASSGRVKTTGATDCRSCHDAQHDPGFQRDAAWLRIMHQREQAPTPR